MNKQKEPAENRPRPVAKIISDLEEARATKSRAEYRAYVNGYFKELHGKNSPKAILSAKRLDLEKKRMKLRLRLSKV